MKKQTNEKRIQGINQIIGKWGAPLLNIFSYGLILALAVCGLSLMTFSMFIGIFIDSGLLSGFGFLTGGVIFTAGGTMALWKVTRELESLCQNLKKRNLA